MEVFVYILVEHMEHEGSRILGAYLNEEEAGFEAMFAPSHGEWGDKLSYEVVKQQVKG